MSDETALWASDSVVGPLAGQLSHHPVTNRDLEASLECLGELASLRAWLDAQEAKLLTRIAELSRRSLIEQGFGGPVAEKYAETVAAAEVGAVLKVPDGSAGRLVEQSKLLVNFFPATVEALQLGRISRRHAVAVAQESCGVPEDEIPDFEEQLLDIARGTTVAKLENRARRLREQLHPETLAVRREKKVRERAVTVEPDRDGMAWLSAYLPAETAYGVAHRVDSTAKALQGPGEQRTLGQLRADVFAGLLTHTCATDPTVAGSGGANASPLPSTAPMLGDSVSGVQASMIPAPGVTGSGWPASGVPGSEWPASGVPGSGWPAPEWPGSGDPGSNSEPSAEGYRGVVARVFVTVPVMTLLGGDESAELDGYGPIDADTARKLAGHAPSFTRLLTHPETGAVLSVGRTRYKPPKDLQDWVRVRDKTCRHPGCNRVASACEIDHTVPWSQDGETRAGNLAALCKKHHMFKTMGFWRHTQPVDGTMCSTSFAGQAYTTLPEPSHERARAHMPPPF